MVDKALDKELREICRDGDVGALEQLAPDRSLSDWLGQAVRAELFDCADLILSAGCGVNDLVGCGTTVLHDTVSYPNAVRYLLQRGANPNLMNHLEELPILKAADDLSFDAPAAVESMNLLVKSGARVNCCDSGGRSLLHIVASSFEQPVAGNEGGDILGDLVELMQAAIAEGSDVNQKADDGFTPLHEAAESGNVGLIRILCDLGADPSLPDSDFRRPMDVARDELRSRQTQLGNITVFGEESKRKGQILRESVQDSENTLKLLKKITPPAPGWESALRELGDLTAESGRLRERLVLLAKEYRREHRLRSTPSFGVLSPWVPNLLKEWQRTQSQIEERRGSLQQMFEEVQRSLQD